LRRLINPLIPTCLPLPVPACGRQAADGEDKEDAKKRTVGINKRAKSGETERKD